MDDDRKLKKYILILSIAMFFISLTQKSYCTTSQCGDSFMVFLLGWAAVLSGAGLPWLANPLLFIAWLTLRRKLLVSMFLSMFAALLCLSFLLFDEISDNESGIKHQIVSYGMGYWLWAGSSICMLIGTFVLRLRQNNRNASKRGVF